MTTTELIKLLQRVEHGASGRPREIRIYEKAPDEILEDIMVDSERLEILSTGDGIAGAELSLIIR